MAYRKLAADKLFTGYEILDNDAVLITDEEGVVQHIVHISDAGEGVERFEGVLSPGFVNCHCHLELSHMKGMIPESLGMVDFLLAVMGERDAPLPEIYAAIEEAAGAMSESGIVAVGDICNTPHTIGQKTADMLYYHNFIEATGFVEARAAARFEAAKVLYTQFHAIGDSSVVPHAPYSVSSELFRLINAFVPGSLMTMHNQESFAENEFFMRGTGKFLHLYKSIGVEWNDFIPTGRSSLVSSFEKLGDHPMILVHNVLTSEEDLQFTLAAGAELYWCLCPNANNYITDRLPDVPMFMKHHCKIVIGTDSLASNHQLDIIEELKTLQQHFQSIELNDLLQWATINGAEALQIEEDYGSFDAGKMPGVVIIKGIEEGRLLSSAYSQRLL